MHERTQATQNRLDAIQAVAAFAISVLLAVGGYLLVDFSERLVVVERVSVTNAEHAREHDNSATHWKSVIKENTERSRTNERMIDRLTSKPHARPDPFTGSMGQVLRERILDLERRLGGQ